MHPAPRPIADIWTQKARSPSTGAGAAVAGATTEAAATSSGGGDYDGGAGSSSGADSERPGRYGAASAEALLAALGAACSAGAGPSAEPVDEDLLLAAAEALAALLADHQDDGLPDGCGVRDRLEDEVCAYLAACLPPEVAAAAVHAVLRPLEMGGGGGDDDDDDDDDHGGGGDVSTDADDDDDEGNGKDEDEEPGGRDGGGWAGGGAPGGGDADVGDGGGVGSSSAASRGTSAGSVSTSCACRVASERFPHLNGEYLAVDGEAHDGRPVYFAAEPNGFFLHWRADQARWVVATEVGSEAAIAFCGEADGRWYAGDGEGWHEDAGLSCDWHPEEAKARA